MVIGAGSLSFELMKSLDRPAAGDALPSLAHDAHPAHRCGRRTGLPAGGEGLASGQSRIFEIGGPDVTTYGDLIREYARQKGLRRWLISVPVLTPYLSGLWLALVTPASFEVGRHLIEGLRNPTVVRDNSALAVFAVRQMGIREAVQKALETQLLSQE